MAPTVQIEDQAIREGDGSQDLAAILLMVLGVILMIVGTLMLVYLGITVFDIMKSPEDTRLVTLLLERTQAEGQAFFGTFGESKVEFTFGEPLRTMLFVLVLLWILRAILNIITSIVGAGRDLVTAARRR